MGMNCRQCGWHPLRSRASMMMKPARCSFGLREGPSVADSSLLRTLTENRADGSSSALA